MRIFTLAACVILFSLILAVTFDEAQATGARITIPKGFLRVESAIGVSLYRKEYKGGTPDYVQVIDLSEGAKIELMAGGIEEMRAGRGAFGGNDARIQSQSLKSYWREARQAHSTLFCVTNGSFFFMKESPTRLPFPLKMDGNLVTDGYGKDQFPGNKLLLALWDQQADILPWGAEEYNHNTAQEILGGLSETANKAGKHYVGRTFVGVADANQDGRSETVLIFNTKSARQVDAARVLREFGAQEVMMLDGGGSTQLMCSGEVLIESDRLIPQAIAVIAGRQSIDPNLVERVLAQPASPESVPVAAAALIPLPQENQPAIQPSNLDITIHLSDLVWVVGVIFVGTVLIMIVFFTHRSN